MKVIAEIHSGKFICEIGDTELKKYLNTYYSDESSKSMNVGDEIDLSRGYDFLVKIKQVREDIKEFIKTSGKEIREILGILK